MTNDVLALRRAFSRSDELSVAALFFWGRSGTVFLHSLFDDHPEVLTLPATRLNSFHGRQWADIQRQRSVDAMIDRFVHWNASLFDGTQDRWFEGLDELGKDRDTPLYVDVARFGAAMRALLEGRAPSRRRFFVAAHYAYAYARGEDLSRKRLLLYHLHSPEAYATVDAALEDFPNMVAVGTVREPVASFTSYLRKNRDVARAWSNVDRADWPGVVVHGGFHFVYRHQLTGWTDLRARTKMPFWELRLEDLHARPRERMQALAQWLGVSWDERLLESTFGGLAYWGDKMARARRNGFDGARKHERADVVLDARDQWVYRGLLGDWIERNGYGSVPRRQRVLAPIAALLPTLLERDAMRDAWSRRDLAAARPLARQVVARAASCLRHAVASMLPDSLRARLPLPKPLSPGLVPPPAPAAQPVRRAA